MARRLFWFAGGGTGGHLFPGIAVAQRLQEQDADARILFVGSDRPIENEILRRTPFEHCSLTHSRSPATVRRPVRFVRGLWKSYREAVRLIRRQPPALVVGCGGFASVAPVMAARRRRVPVVLLEQNVIPGRATRYLCRFAETVCLSFGETAKHLPGRAHTRLTGNPVRAAIAQLASGSHRSEADERTLLVLGGSQGARAVNDLVLAFAVRGGPALCGWRIVHQTGKEGEAIARETYAKHGIQATVAPFFESPETLYQAADLAVARAGGTTLAELACAGVPAIFIPYPHATANHQWHNASVFRDNEAAILCEESHDSPQSHERFCAALTSLLTDEVKRKAMSRAMTRLAHPDAAEQVADVILGLTLPGDSSST